MMPTTESLQAVPGGERRCAHMELILDLSIGETQQPAAIQLARQAACLKGRDAITVVPCMGRERICILPPNSRNLSSTLRIPIPPAEDARCSSPRRHAVGA